MMKKLTKEEIETRLEQLDGWDHVDGALETSFEFKDFKEAFSVMTRIAFECEAQNHHPEWTNVYNTLQIRLNTHDVNGISATDFECAAQIEALLT